MNLSLKSLQKKIRDPNFLSLAGNGSMAVLGLVIMATLYRALSIKEAGIWIFFQSSLVFVDTFRTGFLVTPFVKFYSGSSKERQEEVIGSAWFIAILITAVFVLANIPMLFALKYIENEGMIFFLKWFSINLVITLPSLIGMCIAQGDLRFDRLLYLRISGNGLFFIFILLLIYFNKASLDTVVYANLLSSTITSIISLSAGWSSFSNILKKTAACGKEIFNFGKYTVGTSISASMCRYSDTLIITLMLPNGALAIYNLGNRLMEVVEIPLRSFAATALPKLSSAYNQGRKGEVIRVMKSYVGMLTILLIPVFIVTFIFADLAVGIIGGNQYIATEAGTQAATVLRFFMGFALLYPADRFFAITLDAIHKPKVNFVKVLIMLAVNIITDFIGVLLFKNIYGITIATFFPILTAATIGFWALQKYEPFNFMDSYKSGIKDLKLLYRKQFS
jgi:O-antigen/teichoic acid export membrane protein